MKKIRLCLLFIIALCVLPLANLTAQELPVPLNGGEPLSGRDIGEAVMIDSPDGNRMVFTVEEGGLYAYLSTDGGESFDERSISGNNFSSVRSLEFSSEEEGETMLSFIGTVGSDEGVYLLKGDVRPEVLSLRLDDELSGSIEDYEWIPGGETQKYCLSRKDDRLSLSVLEGERILSNQMIYDGDEKVVQWNCDRLEEADHTSLAVLLEGAAENHIDVFRIDENSIVAEGEFARSENELEIVELVQTEDGENLFWLDDRYIRNISYDGIEKVNLLNDESYDLWNVQDYISKKSRGLGHFVFRIHDNSNSEYLLNISLGNEEDTLFFQLRNFGESKGSSIFITNANDTSYYFSNSINRELYLIDSIPSGKWNFKKITYDTSRLESIEVLGNSFGNYFLGCRRNNDNSFIYESLCLENGEIIPKSLFIEDSSEIGTVWDLLFNNTKIKTNNCLAFHYNDIIFSYINIDLLTRTDKNTSATRETDFNLKNISNSEFNDTEITLSEKGVAWKRTDDEGVTSIWYKLFSNNNSAKKLGTSIIGIVDNIGSPHITDYGIVYKADQKRFDNILKPEFISQIYYRPFKDKLFSSPKNFSLSKYHSTLEGVSSRYAVWSRAESSGGVKQYFYTDLSDLNVYGQKITTSNNTKTNLQIFGDYAVWKEKTNDDYEIYLKYLAYPSSPIHRITSNDYDESNIQLAGNKIAWIGSENGKNIIYQKYLNEPSYAEYRVTDGEKSCYQFKIDSSRIVWIECENHFSAFNLENNNYKLFCNNLDSNYSNRIIIDANENYKKILGFHNGNVIWNSFEKINYRTITIPIVGTVIKYPINGLGWIYSRGVNESENCTISNDSLGLFDIRSNTVASDNSIVWIEGDVKNNEIYCNSIKSDASSPKRIATGSPVYSNLRLSQSYVAWNTFQNEDSEVFLQTLDKTPPSNPTTTSTPPSGTYNNQSISLTPHSTDDFSGVDFYEYSTNGGTSWQRSTGSDSFSRPAPFEGNITVQYRATDNMGNVSGVTTYNITNFDNAPPTFNLTANWQGLSSPYNWNSSSGASSFWLNKDIINFGANISDGKGFSVNGFSLTLPDESSRAVSWSGSGTSKNTAYVLDTSMEGDYSVTLNLVDLAGNTNGLTRLFRVDHTSPIVTPQINTAGVFDGQWTSLANISLTADVINTGDGSPLDQSSLSYSFNRGNYLALDWDGVVNLTNLDTGKYPFRFRASDGAGNTGYSTEDFELWIDRTAPTLSYDLITDYAVRSGENYTVSLDNIASEDDDSGIKSAYTYRFNNDSWATDIEDSPNGSLTITLPSDLTAEGVHDFYLKVYDLVGNEKVVGKSFTLDKTAPSHYSVTGFSEDDDSTLFTSEDFLPFKRPYVHMDSTDEDLARVEYFSSTDWLERDPSPKNWYSADWGSPFQIEKALSNGTNYLYYRGVDRAGNVGNISYVELAVNNEPPAAPIVTSPVFRKALTHTQTTSSDGGLFTIQAQGSGASPIDFYEYQLVIGTRVQFNNDWSTLVAKENWTRANSLEISLDDLSDNEEGMFYGLVTRGISPSGLIGNNAVYVFRVDTAPPTELTPVFEGKSNPDFLYNSTNYRLSWNVPLDMTGVSAYYYTLSDQEITEWEGMTKVSDIPPEWIKASSRLIIGEGLSLFPEDTTLGRVYAAVAAVDFSCLVKTNVTSFPFDIEAPVLAYPEGETENYFTIDYNGDTLVTTLGWGTASDNNSTVTQEIRLIVQGDGDGTLKELLPWTTVEGQTKELVNLDTGLVHTFALRLTDLAGNVTEKSAYFVPGSDDLPDFSKIYKDIEIVDRSLQVTGRANLDYSDVSLTLTSLTPFDLKEVLDDGDVSTSFMPDSFLFDESGTGDLLSLTYSNDRTFQFTSQGFSFKATGMVWAKERGVTFPNLIMALPGGEMEAQFTSVRLNNVEGSLWSESTSDTFADYGFDTSADHVQGWLLENISFARLGAEGVIYTAPVLNTEPSHILYSELYTGEGDIQNHILAMASLPMAQADTIGTADLEPFTLKLGNEVIEVTKATLERDRILVNESWLTLPQGTLADGTETNRVRAGNYYIDPEGLVHNLTGTYCEDFTYTDNYGNVFTIEGVAFGINEVSATGNLVTASGKSFSFSGLVIDPDTMKEDFTAALSGNTVGFQIHNYNLSPTNIFWTPRGFLMNDVRLSLPLVWGDSELIFQGLGVNLDGTQPHIWQAGHSSDSFTLNNSDYGDDILYSGFIIDNDSLRGEHLMVPVPAGLTLSSGSGTLLFEDVVLDYYGSIEAVMSSTPLADSVNTYAGFVIKAAEALYTGEEIRFTELELLAPGEINKSRLSFTGHRANSTEVIEGALSDTACELTKKGGDDSLYTLSLKDMTLREDRITARGVLDLPGYWGDGSLELSHMSIRSVQYQNIDLSLAVGRAIIGGWETVLSEPRATATQLIMGKAEVPFYSEMDCSGMVFTDLTFNKDGSLAGCDLSTDPVEFTSLGGFSVKAETSSLTTGGLLLTGPVSVPSTLVSGSGGEFLFESGNALLMDGSGLLNSRTKASSTESQNLAFGQVKVAASSVRFDGGLLHMDSGEVKAVPFQGGTVSVSLPLEHTCFNSRGEIIESRAMGDRADVNLFSQINLSMGHFKLTNEGLIMDGDLSVPVLLGNSQVYFDNLTFTKEGDVYSTSRVKHLSWNQGEGDWDLYDLQIDPRGLTASTLVVSYPTMDTPLRMRNIRIGSDGSMEIGRVEMDPARWGGMEFYLSTASFADDVFSLGGSVRLPESLPGDLSGLRLSIDQMSMDVTTGELKRLEASVNDSLGFAPAQDWRIQALNPKISYVSGDDLLLEVGEASLSFPPSFGLGKASVEGLEFNLNDGALTFDRAILNDVRKTIGPVDFTFDSLSLDSEFNFSLTGKARIRDIEEVPSDLRGTVLRIREFSVKNTGEIEIIDAAYVQGSGESMSLLEGKVSLANSTLELLYKSGGDFTLGAGGDFTLGESFPEGFAGETLNSNYEVDGNTITGGIKYNITQNKIISFKAGTSIERMDDFLGGTTLKDLKLLLELKEGESLFTLDVGGKIQMPGDESIPEIIRSKDIALKEFVIRGDGSIEKFDVELDVPGKSHLIDGDSDIWIEGLTLGGTYRKQQDDLLMSMDGQITFGTQFPDTLQRTTFTINTFEVSTSGYVNLDVAGVLTEQDLFSGLYLEAGKLGFAYDNGWELSIGGDLVLNNPSLPGVLDGIRADDVLFRINDKGGIEELKADFGNIEGKIYDGLTLKGGNVKVAKAPGRNAMLFNISGGLFVSDEISSLMGGLDGLTINQLILDSERGVTDFTAGLSGDISFNLWSDITVTCTELTVGSYGLSLGGTLALPSNSVFPEPLGGMTFGVDFDANWDGSYDFSCSTDKRINLSYGGFTIRLDGLDIGKSRIGTTKASLILPGNLGVQPLAMSGVYIDQNGFHGSLEMDEIVVRNLGGFDLIMSDPDFNANEQEISFSKVELQGSEIVGYKRFEISAFAINPRGLDLKGISFQIPSFELGNGIGFSLYGSIKPNGDQYFIEAGGLAQVPGMGGLEAKVSFTNVSSTYPIGLKQAYFEYTLVTPGMPLGNSGLFLTALRGGLAFGPPDEVPAVYRPAFESKGTRLQVGVTLETAVKAGLLKGTADMWLDIENFAIAMDGNAWILDGTFNSNFGAAINPNLFYGHVDIRVTYVNGNGDIWIWKDGRYVKFSGRARARVGLAKGSIKQWDWWKAYRWGIRRGTYYIPGSTWWSPYLSTEFGAFEGGSTGFKTYIDAPLLGSIGYYVSTGGKIALGNVSHYKLSKPDGFRSLNTESLRFSTRGSVALDLEEPYIYEDRFTDEDSFDSLSFNIPVSNTTGDGDLTRASSVETLTVTQVERAVFMMSYEDGDPHLTAISPSGESYSAEKGNVEMVYQDNVVSMIIFYPEPGDWTVNIDGLEEGSYYAVEAMGKNTPAKVTVESPSRLKENSRGTYAVEGELYAYAGEQPLLSLFLCKDRESYTGYSLKENISLTNGAFAEEIDTTRYEDGEYYVLASIDDGSGVPVYAYAPGSLIVDNSGNPLAAPENFVISYLDKDQALVTFDDPNGFRVDDYILERDFKGETERSRVGLIQQFRYAVEEGEYVFRLIPVNKEGKESSNFSEIAYTHTADTGRDENRIVVDKNEDDIEVFIDGITDYELEFDFSNRTVTGDAVDYVTIECLEKPELIGLSLHRDSWNIHDAEGTLGLSLSAGRYLNEAQNYVEPVPGDYEVRLRVYNRGDRSNYDDIILNISLTYPEVLIDTVQPEEWHRDDEIELSLSGENFISGVTFYLDGEEIEGLRVGTQDALFEIPAGLAEGEHVLKAELPNGQFSEKSVNVLAPDYILSILKSRETIKQGKEGRFYFSILGTNRFEGRASLTLENPQPDKITALLRTASIASEEEGILDISVGDETPAGSYPVYLVKENGEKTELEIVVTETDPIPVVNGYNPLFTYAGREISILGSHFGEEQGRVVLNGEELAINAWSETKVTVQTALTSVTGDALLYPAGADEGIPCPIFKVRNSGFSMYPEEDTLVFLKGEKAEVGIMVRGAELPVDLSVDSDGLSWRLSESRVTPHHTVQLEIWAPAGLEAGDYSLIIKGVSEIETEEDIIHVTYGEPFSLEDETLPLGVKDYYYEWQFASKYGEGDICYSLKEGDLPGGLSLNQQGLLSGKPSETGSYSFTLEGEDSAGRIAQNTYLLEVSEDSWASARKNGGRNGYVPEKGPVDPVVYWERMNLDGASRAVEGDDRIFLLTTEGIRIHKEVTGQLMALITGDFSDYRYMANQVLALDATGRFAAYESSYGNEIWSREGVDSFFAAGSTVYLKTGDNVKGYRLTASPEYPAGVVTESWTDKEKETFFFEFAGSLSRVVENRIERRDDEGWNVLYEHEEIITDLVVEDERMLFLDEKGCLFNLADGEAVYERQSYREEGNILSDGELTLLYGVNGVDVWREEELILSTDEMLSEAVLMKDKLYGLTEGDLRGINIYSGEDIFEIKGDFLSLIVAQGRLITVEEDRVASWQGPINVDAPETEVILNPVAGTGNLAYFIEPVEMTIETTDRETKTQLTEYRLGDGEWETYTSAVDLPEGEYALSARSVDTEYLYSLEENLFVRVDHTPPVTALAMLDEPDYEEWYGEEPLFALTATDNYSGVDSSYYRLDGGSWIAYENAVTVRGSGTHTLEYYSVDAAGGEEAIHSHQVFIDLEDPTASMTPVRTAEALLIYLEGEDAGSGIDRIEYELNGSGTVVYDEPLVLIDQETHDFRYRAVDRAGRSSQWYGEELIVTAPDKHRVIRDLWFPYCYSQAYIKEDVQTGDSIFWGYRSWRNRFNPLPEELAGSYYLMPSFFHFPFSGVFMTFTAGRDMDVYQLLTENGDPGEGWEMVKDNVDLGTPFIWEELKLYKKSCFKGEQVVIRSQRGSRGFRSQPPLTFAQVKPSTLIITLPAEEETLHPFDTVDPAGWTDILEDGESLEWSFRSGDEESWTQLEGETFTVPYVEEDGLLELRLSRVKEGEILQETRCLYAVVNDSDLDMIKPVPGGQYLTGTTLEEESVIKTFDGTEIPGNVTRSLWNGTDWEESEGELSFDEPGRYRLKYSHILREDMELEEIRDLYIEDELTPLTILFNQEGGDENCAGEIYGIHESGRAFGFSCDHSRDWNWEQFADDFGYFPFARPHYWKHPGVLLREGENFKVALPDGKYRVIVQTGPVCYYYRNWIKLNGEKVNLTDYRRRGYGWLIEKELEIDQGVLKLEGSEDLPLMGLRIIPVEDFTEGDRVTPGYAEGGER